jgi:hypothetical protein
MDGTIDAIKWIIDWNTFIRQKIQAQPIPFYV